MNRIEFFLKYIFIQKIYLKNQPDWPVSIFSPSEIVYVDSFKTDDDVSNEWIRFVAETVVDKSGVEEKIQTLSHFIRALMFESFSSEKDSNVWERLLMYKHLLLPLMVCCKPSVSSLLKLSSVFDDECGLYVPCNIGSWVENNREIFSTDVLFFHDFFRMFERYIFVDVDTYHLNKIRRPSAKHRLSGLVEKEKLKQLYTVVKYADDI